MNSTFDVINVPPDQCAGGFSLNDYAYALPDELIAQTPLAERDQARLMVVFRKDERIVHDRFCHIDKYLPARSLIVRNNTRVIPARLLGVKARSGGKVEIFLLKKKAGGEIFEALLRPLRKIQNGEKIIFEGTSLYAKVLDKEKGIVAFNKKNIIPYLNRVGHVPLPPYIKRGDTPDDRRLYQTIYARHAGSVAAPTAGLHFTEELMGRLVKKGFLFTDVTLHINYATFKPVEEPDIRRHKMHTEEYAVPARTVAALQSARQQHRPVVAIGTTACRVLETLARGGARRGMTDIFIYPGHSFKSVDALVTNFHLPMSTLLMLVYAFASPGLMRRAYQEAIAGKYRFFSYGDAMLIL